MPNRQIVIFDGLCNLCNGLVNFVIKRDPKGVFGFVPLQGQFGQSFMLKYNIPEREADAVILIKNGRHYLRSDAVLEIIRDISGLWFLFRVIKLVPRPLRDAFYRIFARNRYRLFGKRDYCVIPADDVRSRFMNGTSQDHQAGLPRSSRTGQNLAPGAGVYREAVKGG